MAPPHFSLCFCSLKSAFPGACRQTYPASASFLHKGLRVVLRNRRLARSFLPHTRLHGFGRVAALERAHRIMGKRRARSLTGVATIQAVRANAGIIAFRMNHKASALRTSAAHRRSSLLRNPHPRIIRAFMPAVKQKKHRLPKPSLAAFPFSHCRLNSGTSPKRARTESFRQKGRTPHRPACLEMNFFAIPSIRSDFLQFRRSANFKAKGENLPAKFSPLGRYIFVFMPAARSAWPACR